MSKRLVLADENTGEFSGVVKEQLNTTIGSVVETDSPQVSAERPRPSTPLETNLLVVFMDDDGRAPGWSTLRPFYQSKDVPVGWAITTDNIGTSGHMTWDQVRTLATDVTSDGKKSEILNHSKTHASLASADAALAKVEIEDAYDILVAQGLNPEGFVWTYTDSNSLAAQVVRKRHRYGFGGIAGGGGTNTPIWSYAMGRQLINGASTLASLKANFDGRSTGVLVYFTHSTDIPTTSILSEFIDYIRARANCEIVSPNEAMSRYANLQDIGNRPWGAGYRVLTRDGKVVSDLEFSRSGGTVGSSIFSAAWTTFALGVTVHACTAGGPGIGSGSVASPTGNGTLETIVTDATQNGYAVQRFYEYGGGAGQNARGHHWIRQSTGASTWTAWRRVMLEPAIATAAPSSAPTFVGQQYLDTTNKKLYVATGTSTSADWIVLN
jgi:hypothetical protein